MNDAQSYRVSKLGARCYKFTQDGSPERGYLLIVSSLDRADFNYQATLATFNDENPEARFFAFEQEVYSVQFFSKSVKLRHEFMEMLVQLLINDDLTNPIQVALAVGGIVCNEQVRTPPPVLSNYH